MIKNVHIVIDGQAGSCGKGKVCAEFALEEKPDLAITNNMPNAGHTSIVNNKKRIFRNIPVSSINPKTALFIGAGSVIDEDVLKEEYHSNLDILKDREIIAHPNIPIVELKHKKEEQEKLRSGSTFKGGGSCLAEKIMRPTNLELFKGYKNIKVVSYNEYYNRLKEYLEKAKKILIEGAQGCDLDINHSGHYPYTTSRQISVAQMLADSGISPKYLKEVIMVIRPFPIRISNETDLGLNINSGNYGKSKELSWLKIEVASYYMIPAETVNEDDINRYFEEIADIFSDEENRLEMFSKDDTDNDFPNFEERTTVTNKVRRVFEIDINQLKRNIMINTPDYIYLNFFQHMDYTLSNLKGNFEDFYVSKYLREYLNYFEDELGVPIEKLGTSAEAGKYIKRKVLK